MTEGNNGKSSQGSSKTVGTEKTTSPRLEDTDESVQKPEENLFPSDETFYQAIVEEMDEVVFVLNQAGTLVYANNAATECASTSLADLQGQHITALVSEMTATEADEEQFNTAFEAVLETPHQESDPVSRSIEVELELPAGTAIGEFQLKPIRAGDSVTGVLVVAHDITKRKQRERRYVAVFNQTYQFTGLLEPDGTVLEANETALEFGGLSREEVIEKPFWDADWWQDDPDTRQWVREAVDQAATGEFVRDEIEAQGSEETAILDFSIRPVTDDQENVTLLIPEGRDITGRKQRERELRQAEERLSIALSAANAGVWEWDMESGEIVWEETMERILGLDPGSFEGTLDAFLDRVHPDDTEKLEANIQTAIEEGGTVQWEIRLAHEDGGHRWVDTRAQVFTNSEGTPKRIIGIGIDSTDRKERKQKLTALKQRYETLLEAAPDPVFVADAETGEIIELNGAAETLLGEPREQIIGCHQTALHPAEDAELYREAFNQIEGEQTIVRELPDGSLPKLVTAHNESIPIEISVGTLSLPDGPVIYGIFRDVSEQIERKKELETLKQIFSRIFRHDVRNKLNIAQGHLNLIKEETETHTASVESALDAIDHVLTRAEGVRKIRELDDRNSPTIVRNLSTLVSNAVSDYQYDERVTVETDVSDGTVQLVEGFEAVIEMAIENAIEHNPTPVSVSITTDVRRKEAILLVADDGDGIPTNEIDTLTTEEETPLSHSTGVGLWTMKWYVKKSGGCLSVEATDSGTELRITLPRTSENQGI